MTFQPSWLAERSETGYVGLTNQGPALRLSLSSLPLHPALAFLFFTRQISNVQPRAELELFPSPLSSLLSTIIRHNLLAIALLPPFLC